MISRTLLSRIDRSGGWLVEAAYKYRRRVCFATYGAIACVAYVCAFLLRFEFRWPHDHTRLILLTLPLLVVVRLLSDAALQLTNERWRFVSLRDVARLLAATVLGSGLFWVATSLLNLSPVVPRSVILIEAVLTVMGTAGLWMTYRAAFEYFRRLRSGGSGAGRRVLVIGAGEAANLLVREMRRLPSQYVPIGFVDDDPLRWGTTMQGLEVIGSTRELASIAETEGADELILAIPSAAPSELRRLVEACEDTGLPFKVLPGVSQVLAGDVRIDQLRDVQIEDLLGREPVKLDLPELASDLADRCVLITGAAGSIGSELSRQIALHAPRHLVLLDQAETEMFYLEHELRDRHPGLNLTAVIADIVDRNAMARVFAAYQPNHVFHAAAYKHVPMMQTNPIAAIKNNLFGTLRVADAAGRFGACKFILVSTDKAVEPSSVMGATKRLAELVCLELQSRYAGTCFGAVRFGNVLGSSGSVIPLFKRQLAAGGPLRVTHPDVTRYFMTIPEAVQLILQASLLDEIRGHIAMLDMGEAVRIVDLAKNLVRLTGNGAHQRSIVFTGLRPGEKLHEELVAPSEEASATSIPKVRILKSNGLEITGAAARSERWVNAIAEGAFNDVLEELYALFPRLQPTSLPLAPQTSTAPNHLNGRVLAAQPHD